MPPSFIVCGTADALLPESRALAEALERTAIPHELHVFNEMPHGFLQMEQFVRLPRSTAPDVRVPSARSLGGPGPGVGTSNQPSQLDWERLHRALAVSWKLPPCRSMITTAGKSRTVNF